MQTYHVTVSCDTVLLEYLNVNASSLSAAVGKIVRRVAGKRRKGKLNEIWTIQVIKTSSSPQLQASVEEPTLF